QTLPDLTLADIQRIAAERGPAGVQVSDAVWMSRFHISHRKVESFRKLRVFLAGDAAHIHSPAGGQGMNTGIQDAFNLAWKLALVLQGRAPLHLLGTYESEREPVVRKVINLTDRLTRIATTKSPITQGVRNFLMPLMTQIDFVEESIADQISELKVNYRRSEIVEHHGGGSLRAGDRAPDCELRLTSGQSCRLFELFREPKHVLLVFTGARATEINDIRALIAPFSDSISIYSLGRGRAATADLGDITGAAHSTYQLPHGGLVLVRPDGYIAFRSDEFNAAQLRSYLNRIFSL
ncbi:MAG TPA: FAD-dependent monooxygenase, partial [Chthoniobacterales bacterium]